MKKGKSRNRPGRRDLLRNQAANDRRRQRARKRYDRKAYDGTQIEEQ